MKRLCFERFTSPLALEVSPRLRRDLHFGAVDEGELELGLEAATAGEEDCAGLTAALGADDAGLDAGAAAEAGAGAGVELLDAAPDGFHGAGPGMGKVCGSSLFTSNLAKAPLGS